MNQRQKMILIILALINILVIGGIGYTVWRNSQLQPPSTLDATPCSNLALRNIPSYLSPAIAWDPEQLYIAVTAIYDVPVPPPGSAQLLWAEIDGLSNAVKTGCPLPPRVTLTATARGTITSLSHVAVLQGEDITAWVNGTIPQEELAARAAYRTTAIK